jgi:iron complex transport system substrate-binding protein
MKIQAFILILLTLCIDRSVNARTITDMAGRVVTIPDTIRTVMQGSPVTEIVLCALVPEKLIGTGMALTEKQKILLPDVVKNKPVIGMMGGGKNNTFNPEQILKMHPDIIVSAIFSSVEKMDLDAVERIQKQLDIPVVLIDGSIEKTDTACKFLGKLLGCSDKGDSLGNYLQKKIFEVQESVSKIDTNKKKRIYYAEGANGLYTESKNSRHAEVIKLAGGCNVADIPAGSASGMVAVSIEQILVWQPEVIIVSVTGDNTTAQLQNDNFTYIKNNSTWNALSVIKAGMVFKIPYLPFNWFDRPPGINRILGLRWLAKLLYPDLCIWNIRDDTREFYKWVYGVTLTEQQLDEILIDAGKKETF